MRLALVRQRYNPHGGAERFIERALGALGARGVEVTLIARSWGDGGRDGDSSNVQRVDPFYLGSLWRDAGFARAARRAWRCGGFDLVQSHERIAGCDLYRAGDGVHRQWLAYRRSGAGWLERLGIDLSPYHRYVCAAERRLFEHPALRAVICNSRMVRDEIARHFAIDAGKLHVIYNGVDLAHFDPARRAQLRAAARAELGCGAGDTLFLFVGSGFARKGLDTAIGALARTGRGDLRLAVAGRDREAARFAGLAARAGVSGRVALLGGRGDVRPLYAAADCFILPTRYDPFPNTALEALAMGLPAIVSRRCGAAEVVREGQNGWLCEADDEPGLASLMSGAPRAIEGGRMARAARETAEQYGMDEMARQMQGLYATLAAA